MSKKRILVVDDETSITRLLKLNLEQTGNYEWPDKRQGRQRDPYHDPQQQSNGL